MMMKSMHQRTNNTHIDGRQRKRKICRKMSGVQRSQGTEWKKIRVTEVETEKKDENANEIPYKFSVLFHCAWEWVFSFRFIIFSCSFRFCDVNPVSMWNTDTTKCIRARNTDASSVPNIFPKINNILLIHPKRTQPNAIFLERIERKITRNEKKTHTLGDI